MKITFLGASKTVTGSCYLLEANSKKILIDCGLFQGHADEYILNSEPFDFNPSEIDYLLLTHSHIDHSGKIPKLVKDGFKGTILATKSTVQLCTIMLPDSGHIQENENEWLNRKRQRAGKDTVNPIYTVQDAINSLRHFSGVLYDEFIKLPGNITVKFTDSGHMLGSAIIELWVNENGEEIKLVFSGDLGNKGLPLLKDPSLIDTADYLFIESTYGDRLHKDTDNKADKFIKIINETIENGGNVIIPSFAVGRTQEIIYELHKEKEKFKSEFEKLKKIPVYVDSPLAISATQVFRNNLDDCDEEARAYIENGENPLDFPGLKFAKSSDESRELNEKEENMVIISASGMCDAGRVRHHIKHNIWRPECTILFVGYQAQGTLGRRIVDGAKKIKVYGEDISVKARIEMIDGFSGHADQNGLLEWVRGFEKTPANIFIIHGEEEAQIAFQQKLEEEFDCDTIIPDKGETYILSKSNCYKYSENHNDIYKYVRLGALDEIEQLEEEFQGLLKTYKMSLKNRNSDDYQIDEVRIRIEQLKKHITNTIR